MRRYLPALLLALVAAAPFPLTGCDMIAKMRGGDDDAGSDAAIVAVAEVDAAAAVAEVDAATPPGTAPPLPTGTLTAVRPVVKADGGPADASVAPVIDAGAVKTDGGPAPTPTPTFTIPINLFDGGFKFDAGGLKFPR